MKGRCINGGRPCCGQCAEYSHLKNNNVERMKVMRELLRVIELIDTVPEIAILIREVNVWTELRLAVNDCHDAIARAEGKL
jgi:hypothetical protein